MKKSDHSQENAHNHQKVENTLKPEIITPLINEQISKEEKDQVKDNETTASPSNSDNNVNKLENKPRNNKSRSNPNRNLIPMRIQTRSRGTLSLCISSISFSFCSLFFISSLFFMKIYSFILCMCCFTSHLVFRVCSLWRCSFLERILIFIISFFFNLNFHYLTLSFISFTRLLYCFYD